MIIKGEVGDLNCTSAAIDGRRQPIHPPIIGDQYIGIVGHVKLAINATENGDKGEREEFGGDLVLAT